jgi:hypothetical protein
MKDQGYSYKKNFISHFPFYVEKDKLIELNKQVSIRDNFPFENLYYNYFKMDGVPLGNLKSGHYSSKDQTINNKALILNHDEIGFIKQPWIINLLYKLFPNQSKFEIPKFFKV